MIDLVDVSQLVPFPNEPPQTRRIIGRSIVRRHDQDSKRQICRARSSVTREWWSYREMVGRAPHALVTCITIRVSFPSFEARAADSKVG